MVGEYREDGKYVKGIEDFFPKEQYESDEFQTAVVKDIIENWLTMRRNNKFHAIFATSSIPETIRHYELMNAHVTKDNINEYGRFTALKDTVVKEKAAHYFSSIDGKSMPMFRVNNRVNDI